MPVFTLASIAAADAALSTMNHVHGAYRAIDVLANLLGEVEEPASFDETVKVAEAKVGSNYQGPDNAAREVLKAVKTAANSDPRLRETLVKLITLALTRLGTAQATHVLAILIVSAGMDPSLTSVVLKICLLLARSKPGRQIALATAPHLQNALRSAAERNPLRPLLQELDAKLGEQSGVFASLLDDTAKLGRQAAGKAAEKGAEAWSRALDAIVWPIATDATTEPKPAAPKPDSPKPEA